VFCFWQQSKRRWTSCFLAGGCGGGSDQTAAAMNMGVFINRGSSRDPWGDCYVLVWLAGEHLRIVSGKCDEAVAGSRHGVARQTAGGSVCLSFCTLAGLCVLCICLSAYLPACVCSRTPVATSYSPGVDMSRRYNCYSRLFAQVFHAALLERVR